MGRISAWWASAPPTQKALVGFGVPLVALVALMQTRRKPAPVEAPAPKPAADPQIFAPSPFDLAKLSNALRQEDGGPGVSAPTSSGPDLSKLSIRELQDQCSAAAPAGGEPYISELNRRGVSVNDPGFSSGLNKEGYPIPTPCGALYVMRRLAAGDRPACDPRTDPYQCKGKPSSGGGSIAMTRNGDGSITTTRTGNVA